MHTSAGTRTYYLIRSVFVHAQMAVKCEDFEDDPSLGADGTEAWHRTRALACMSLAQTSARDPEPPLAECEECGDHGDPDDLDAGLCPRCARDDHRRTLGETYAPGYSGRWMANAKHC